MTCEENYDMFCQINKINEKRKALSKFFINLMNNNVIEKEEIISIIMLLIEVTDRNLKNSDSRYIIDEISEKPALLSISLLPLVENGSNTPFRLLVFALISLS